jgi:hypothetical protein
MRFRQCEKRQDGIPQDCHQLRNGKFAAVGKNSRPPAHCRFGRSGSLDLPMTNPHRPYWRQRRGMPIRSPISSPGSNHHNKTICSSSRCSLATTPCDTNLLCESTLGPWRLFRSDVANAVISTEHCILGMRQSMPFNQPHPGGGVLLCTIHVSDHGGSQPHQ